MSWITEVTNGGGRWIANRMRFDSPDEASAYVNDLKNRCRWVTAVRVLTHKDPATHRYVNGELLMKLELKTLVDFAIPEDIKP